MENVIVSKAQYRTIVFVSVAFLNEIKLLSIIMMQFDPRIGYPKINRQDLVLWVEKNLLLVYSFLM